MNAHTRLASGTSTVAGAASSVAGASVLLLGFVGGTGGASVLMLELATALRDRGLRPRIVVPAWESTLAYAAACRERSIAIDRTEWLKEREPRTVAYMDAARLVARYRAPIVHYHLSTNTMPARYIPALRWLGGQRAFVTMHDPYDDPPADSPQARRWAAAAPALFRQVICVSRAGYERQLRYGIDPRHVRLIYNGVDVARFSSGRGERARAALGIDASTPLIVVSSRVASQKRPLDAVTAFSRIAAEFPNARLVFVGDGPLVQDVRDAAGRVGLGERIHLVGHQFNIPDWLNAATAWLLPTESEGFSIALIEAMAAGCPIVTTWCPGNDEVLVRDSNALVTSVGDVDAMAAALRQLLHDDVRRAELSAAARRTAERFSIDHMVDAHIDTYATADDSIRRAAHSTRSEPHAISRNS